MNDQKYWLTINYIDGPLRQTKLPADSATQAYQMIDSLGTGRPVATTGDQRTTVVFPRNITSITVEPPLGPREDPGAPAGV